MKSKSAFIIKRMIPFIFFMAMLLVNENAWAQNIPSPFRSTDEEIKAYLKNKYVLEGEPFDEYGISHHKMRKMI